MNRWWSRAIVAAALSMGAASIGAAAAQDGHGRRDGSQLFKERVAVYAELRQRLDAVFAPFAPTYDMHLIERGRAYLASAIRARRLHARQGDIFEASAATILRGAIADALDGVDVDLMLNDLYEECEMPVGYRPQVNANYPDWATHTVPVAVLIALPVLPDGIQYRLIDHDLLLLDVDAALIIDVLPDALARAGS